MGLAALPFGAEDPGDCGFQSFMGIGDHQLGAVRATSGQAAQELAPEQFGLAVARGHTEHFASNVGVDADGNDHRDGGDLVVTPDFDPSAIQKKVRLIALYPFQQFAKGDLIIGHPGSDPWVGVAFAPQPYVGPPRWPPP